MRVIRKKRRAYLLTALFAHEVCDESRRGSAPPPPSVSHSPPDDLYLTSNTRRWITVIEERPSPSFLNPQPGLNMCSIKGGATPPICSEFSRAFLSVFVRFLAYLVLNIPLQTPFQQQQLPPSLINHVLHPDR